MQEDIGSAHLPPVGPEEVIVPHSEPWLPG